MLVDELIKIVQQGAALPIGFWIDELRLISDQILPRLKTIQQKLNEDTQTNQHVKDLITLLRSQHLDEFQLAKNLLYILDLVRDQQPTYLTACRQFYERAQSAHLLEQARMIMKQQMSEAEQHDYDARLFQNEGMFYCLEFYLALYKTIKDAATDQEKQQYIVNETINIGSGELPGLRADFINDEVLNTFIYKIIDDAIRQELLTVYYQAKVIIVNQTKSTAEIVEAFKSFIEVLIKVYQQMGITSLASSFFKPYGDKPALTEINL